MQISLAQQCLRLAGHQSWLPGRGRLLKILADPDTKKPYPFEVKFFGRPYSGNLTNFIDWHVFYYGACGIHELRLLGEIADALRAQGKPVNFFDVGANIGHHTLFMSDHSDAIFSFEPYSVVRDEMQRKLKHADVRNVTIFPVALGDQDESHTFHPPTGWNQGTGTLGELLPENASKESISVQVVHGDTFFAANRLPSISLLKMDVEGYELKALEGLRETLWRDRPPIFMEFQLYRERERDILKHKKALDLIYPDHVIFEVGDDSHGHYVLKPFSLESTEEALVLPVELAEIIRSSMSR
jgi:FkbM family methyltransferase